MSLRDTSSRPIPITSYQFTFITRKTAIAHRCDDGHYTSRQETTSKGTMFENSANAPGVTRITIGQGATPVIVSRAQPDIAEGDRISTKAVIGTLLGAGAGAAIAYAMAKSEDEPMTKTTPYNTYEVPTRSGHENAIVIETVPSRPEVFGHERVYVQQTDSPGVHRVISGPRARTIVSSTHSKGDRQPEVSRSILPASPSSRTGRTIAQTSGIKVLAGPLPSKTSNSSPSTTKHSPRREPSQSSHHSKTSTIKVARQMPLPASKISTVRSKPFSSSSLSDIEDRGKLDRWEGTIVPDDSISQVSTNIPEKYEKPPSRRSDHKAHRSSHHRRNSHHKSRKEKETSSRAGSKRGSILGIPLRPK